MPEVHPEVKEIAAWLQRRRLAELARFGLEVGRPLSLIAAQLLWVSQPVVGIFSGEARVARWAELLEQPDAVDQLLEQLTTPTEASAGS